MWGEQMKNIYIDVLITVNIFIDYFLLLCTKRLLNISIKYKRIIFGSIAGGFTSLIALLPSLLFGLNILIDLLVAMLIIFISFGRCNIKTYIRRVAIFFTLSFAFCGIMIFIYLSFSPSGMGIYNDVVYFDISPVLLIILTLISYYTLKLLKKLTKNVYTSQVCNVEVYLDEKVYNFSAKSDSGCNLKEPFSGKSVIIAEKQLFENFIPDESKIRVIPYESLGGNGIIRGFPADKVIIDKKIYENCLYIGLCENILKGDIKALIPAEILYK